MAMPAVLEKLRGSEDDEVRGRIEAAVARAQELGLEGAALEFFFETVAQYEALLVEQRSGRVAAEAFGHYQQWVINAYRLQVQGFEAGRAQAA